MSVFHTIQDPLGNQVRLNPDMLNNDESFSGQLQEIVSSPSFVIQVTNKSLYFIRKVNPDLNILVEARYIESSYVIHSLINNPTVQYISDLLNKGNLIAFNSRDYKARV